MDLDLARRLERTEGAVSASFPPVKQRVAPGSNATWHDFAGTYAIFDGVDSPMTQTFGLGLFEAATPALLSDIEAFFDQRGAPIMHEVSPLAGVEALALLTDRGYRPIELSTVLAQGIEGAVGAPASHDLRVRRMEPADRPAWVDASVAGWANDPTFAAIMRSLAEVASANEAMSHFLVERDGAPIATGSMGIHDGVALLAGASTIPSERGRGTQAILLAARLAEARRQRCEIAMMVAAPGSTSQRNAERNGFRVAYTRTKWRLARPAS
ncbi:MAG: GNAT family N-acetyltransferase [bacterium]